MSCMCPVWLVTQLTQCMMWGDDCECLLPGMLVIDTLQEQRQTVLLKQNSNADQDIPSSNIYALLQEVRDTLI